MKTLFLLTLTGGALGAIHQCFYQVNNACEALRPWILPQLTTHFLSGNLWRMRVCFCVCNLERWELLSGHRCMSKWYVKFAQVFTSSQKRCYLSVIAYIVGLTTFQLDPPGIKCCLEVGCTISQGNGALGGWCKNNNGGNCLSGIGTWYKYVYSIFVFITGCFRAL
jgi:hypothetical protein